MSVTERSWLTHSSDISQLARKLEEHRFRIIDEEQGTGSPVLIARRAEFRFSWVATRLHVFVVVFEQADLRPERADELSAAAQEYAIAVVNDRALAPLRRTADSGTRRSRCAKAGLVPGSDEAWLRLPGALRRDHPTGAGPRVELRGGRPSLKSYAPGGGGFGAGRSWGARSREEGERMMTGPDLVVQDGFYR